MSKSRVAERSADYVLRTVVEPTFGASFDLLATAPQGVAKLRELILSLAVRGKLSALDQNLLDNPLRTAQRSAGVAGTDSSWLPPDWQAITLSQLGRWAIGSGFPTVEQGRQGLSILFAKVSDMNLQGNEEEIIATNNTIDVETASRLRINVHPPGTVVFPKIGGAIATNKRRLLVRPTAIDNNCLGIIPNSSCSSAYMYLLLKSFDFTQYQVGTSVPALNQGTLGEIPVGLPPLAEQARIVARVEELMQLCDALEAHGRLQDEQHARLVATLFDALAASASAEELAENWQRIATHFDLLLDRPEAVDTLEQTLLQLAVRGQLVPQNPTDEPASELLARIRAEKNRLIATGEIKPEKPRAAISEEELPCELPSRWRWIRLDDLLIKIGAGSTPRGGREVYTSAGVKFLRSQNIWNDGLMLSGVAHISEATHERMSGTKVVGGDLLFNITGASIGRCALVPDDFDEANVSQHVTIIRTVYGSVRQFLHLVLISQYVQQTVMDVQVGVSREGLSIGKLRQFVIPLPPLAEQHRIVARVEQLRRLCADLRERLQQARATQSSLAEALVSAAAESPSC